MNQNELYQQVILEHNRKPRNFCELENPTHSAEGFNPLCGDHLWVYVDLGQDGIIKKVSFTGSGCAISKASASMMTGALIGCSLEQAKNLFLEFHKLLKGELDPEKEPNQLGKLKLFASIWQYPSRIKCAGLAWHALSGALEDNSKTISTEA